MRASVLFIGCNARGHVVVIQLLLESSYTFCHNKMASKNEEEKNGNFINHFTMQFLIEHCLSTTVHYYKAIYKKKEVILLR